MTPTGYPHKQNGVSTESMYTQTQYEYFIYFTFPQEVGVYFKMVSAEVSFLFVQEKQVRNEI